MSETTTVSTVWLNQIRDQLLTAVAELDRLTLENAALRLNDQRYRHLRQAGLVLAGHDFMSFDEVADVRVDAAIIQATLARNS